MFRDTDFGYLVLSLVAVLACNVVTIWCNGAWFPDPVEIIKWQSTVVPVSLIILATVEVLRVIADRIIKRLNQKDQDATVQRAVQEALENVRQDSAMRWGQAVMRFGSRDKNGALHMELTPEVLEFVLGGTNIRQP